MTSSSSLRLSSLRTTDRPICSAATISLAIALLAVVFSAGPAAAHCDRQCLNCGTDADAIEFARAMLLEDTRRVSLPFRNSGSQPFLLDHGRRTVRGAILIHSFTGTPWEMRDLGEHLHAAGYSVYGVRLEGHGTDPEELRRTTWPQWQASTHCALAALSVLSSSLVGVGGSLGGLVVLDPETSSRLSASVVIAPAISVRSIGARFAWLLQYAIPYSLRSTPLPPGLQPHYYESRSIAAVAQVVAYATYVETRLSLLRIPTLVIQDRADAVVAGSGPTTIAARARGPVKVMWVNAQTGPRHVLAVSEPEVRGRVFQAIAHFLEAHGGTTTTHGPPPTGVGQ